ncbi:hypothetical protein M4L90_12140 [Staphylococcus equorum]|uniref:Uncharacterized protein n=1 Tax=Staphylococcus equorum TaxID=246432 RepID=A0A9X4L541_9STAP|nr:hypothetical protein [Staphylococcus equorum]MDG0820669.1 hypothetical protein [Staphylococcus equorum]MDG0841294.1 hypothetical protein [Staphylococcus equorum]MDG0846994.1 hypothetical protein [Staphylococcus equorum]OEL08293.1 hypothetical protein AST04_08895 [Staphylococcus equorum]PTE82270.1 hypothetical protein BUY85_00605 [Staphylococcus equorum]
MTTINTIDELKENIEYFNENHDLTHGNSEVFGQRNGDYYIYSVIEGTNHTTLNIMFDEQQINAMLNGQFITTLKTEYQKVIADFDVDETFNELWSMDFAEHNSFTPRSFIEILEEDKAHFEDLTFETSA